MKIYDKIIQGTDEWKELRHGKIGGSTAGELMTKINKPVRECAEYYSLLSEAMEDFDPFQSDYQNAAMQRGNEYEPIARKEYERIYGEKVGVYGWVEMDCKMIGISPDGWMPEKKKSIEIKCPEGSTHVKYLLHNSEFLETYCWQIVHNFLVLEVETMDCISFRPENKYVPLIVIPVSKDTKISISKKETYTISELVEIERKRLEEVKNAIETDILIQTTINQF